MRKFLTSAFALVLLLNVAWAQAPQLEQVTAALQAGNARALATMLSDHVELRIENSGSVYSRAQAEEVLRDFFSKNPPNSFQVNHKGGQADAQYAIGTLVTPTASYRTVVYLKMVDGVLRIPKLTFKEKS